MPCSIRLTAAHSWRLLKVRVSRSARKHKLSAGRIRQALVNATRIREEADAAVYVGTDDEGVEIELVIVADDRSDDGFTVIQAMPTAWRQR